MTPPSSPLLLVLPPPLHAGRLASSTVSVVPVILLLGALALYLWGAARVNDLRPRHPWSRWRTTAFVAGCVVTALSIFSFVGVYADTLFWDHMVQHLMLIMVAAALFAMSSPLLLLWQATRGGAHERVTRFLRSPVAEFFGNPIVAFVLYAVVIPITHLTSFFNYALVHQSVSDLEHLIFLVVGYLFWRQIFGSEPSKARMHPAMKMLYLFLAIPVDTFTGLSLDSATQQMFPAYTAMHRTWGPSGVLDLHIGGVIMWVAGDTLMTLAMIPVAIEWLHVEERRAVRVDRELDAILPGRGPGGTDIAPRRH